MIDPFDGIPPAHRDPARAAYLNFLARVQISDSFHAKIIFVAGYGAGILDVGGTPVLKTFEVESIKREGS